MASFPNAGAVPLKTVVLASGPIHVAMENESLVVIAIPKDSVPTFAWWIIREYCLERCRKTCFHSILLVPLQLALFFYSIHLTVRLFSFPFCRHPFFCFSIKDDDGLSLVCSASSVSALEALNAAGLQFNPQKWRAFVINVYGGWTGGSGGSAEEFPGAVHYLADSLSSEGMSILHISTFESEVFLVQEQDIEKACTVLRRAERPKELAGLLEQRQQQRQESEIDRPVKEGLMLCVVPGQVMLARLSNEYTLSQLSDVLIKLMLFDERYSPLERMVNKGLNPSQFKFSNGHAGLSSSAFATVGTSDDHDDVPSSNPPIATAARVTSGDRATFIWGLWQCENELTFLLDESDIGLFPEGALEISPQRWKLIKLCGRAIDFDETGIVSAMSKIDVNVPSLNISTATTNCTLVPEELLESTLADLSDVLKCPVRDFNP